MSFKLLKNATAGFALYKPINVSHKLMGGTSQKLNNYIFAGSRVQTKPFQGGPDGNIEYFGDETRNEIQVSEQRYVRFNRTGTDVFARVVRQSSSGELTGRGFFEALGDLVDGIKHSNTDAMNQGINDLDQASYNLAVATAQVGSEMGSVETQRVINEESALQLRTALSNVEDLDYSKAVTEMQKNMLALQATQSSFSKISGLTLFNYLN